jgi:prepilin-type processing-associated H-X9-DG protein
MKRNQSPHRGLTKIEMLVVLGILVVLFMFLGPATGDPRSAARRMQCTYNLKEAAIAIHSYHDKYGTLPSPSGPIVPPAFDEAENSVATASDDWSWRVRLLPFIEEQELYDQFRFDEPWDSEHNLTVAETIPDGYCCPSNCGEFKEINGHKIPLTNYVMVTGPDTVGPTDGMVRTLPDVTDGTGKTLMLVEVWGESRPAWIEPIDITLEDLARGVNSESGKSISGDHISRQRMFFDDEFGGINFCFADGSVSLFADKTMPSPELLRQMAIINDGKPLKLE